MHLFCEGPLRDGPLLKDVKHLHAEPDILSTYELRLNTETCSLWRFGRADRSVAPSENVHQTHTVTTPAVCCAAFTLDAVVPGVSFHASRDSCGCFIVIPPMFWQRAYPSVFTAVTAESGQCVEGASSSATEQMTDHL